MAATSRVDGTDDDLDYIVSGSDLEGMIARYSRIHPEFHQGPRVEPRGFELQVEKIRTKLAKRSGLLRRQGCHPYSLDTPTAVLLVKSTCDSVSILSSEVWQRRPEPGIETLLNEIHRRILGVEKKTCTSAVRHELGITSQ